MATYAIVLLPYIAVPFQLREVDVTEKAHTQLLREYRKLQKSWRCGKGDYKGWKQMKRWMGSWMKLENLKIEFYMENDAFDKLVSYYVNIDKKSKQQGFDRLKDRSRFSKLDAWRIRNGYGTYAVGKIERIFEGEIIGEPLEIIGEPLLQM